MESSIPGLIPLFVIIYAAAVAIGAFMIWVVPPYDGEDDDDGSKHF